MLNAYSVKWSARALTGLSFAKLFALGLVIITGVVRLAQGKTATHGFRRKKLAPRAELLSSELGAKRPRTESETGSLRLRQRPSLRITFLKCVTTNLPQMATTLCLVCFSLEAPRKGSWFQAESQVVAEPLVKHRN